MCKLLRNALLTLLLGGFCIGILCVTNRLAAPQPRVLPPTGVQPPDYAAIAASITPDSVGKDLGALLDPRAAHREFFWRVPRDLMDVMESRSSAAERAHYAATEIEEELRKLGYKVLGQPFRLTVPATRHAELYDDRGAWLREVRVRPLLPNWFRTASTPEGGLRGVVLRGEKGLAREFKDVDLRGNFALLPLGAPWTTVASLGAKAVLYCDDGTPAPPARWEHHVDASLDVPRFLVQGDAKALVGKRVTLKAGVALAEAPFRNVVAVLEAPQGSEEALVVHAFYDSHSYVPDVAPGAQQACGAAMLLSVARRLATEQASLKRSVVLLATAGHGQGLFGIREFLRALGTREGRGEARVAAEGEAAELASQVKLAIGAILVANDPAFWSAMAQGTEDTYWRVGCRVKEKGLRACVHDRLRAILDQDLMATIEDLTQRRVDWVRNGMTVRDATGEECPSFRAYEAARKRQLAVQTIIATSPARLGERWGRYVEQNQTKDRVLYEVELQFAALDRRHGQADARAELAMALAPYQRLLFLGLDLTARSGRLGLVCGQQELASACMPADAEIAAQFQRAAEGLQAADPGTTYASTKRGQPRFANLVRENDVRDLPFVTEVYGAPLYFESLAALWGGHTAFSLVTLDDNRERMGTPHDTLEALLGEKAPAAGEEPALANLCVTARLVAAVVSQLARGYGRVVPISRHSDLYTLRGRVVSQIGDSLTPNHPMPGALVRLGPVTVWGSPRISPPGVGTDLVVTADEQGRFELPAMWPSALSHTYYSEFDLDAAVVRPEDGQITWSLSIPKSGVAGPYRVRNLKIAEYRERPATAVVFRASPVEIVAMANPATLRPYAELGFIEAKNLAPPAEFKVESARGAHVCFVPPDSRLYFTFKEGKQSNPQLMEIRAFALGATGPADGSKADPGQDIVGQGYLAADTPAIPNIELDAALSMAQLNARRTRLQERHGMADDMVLSYSQKATALADEAQKLAAAGRLIDARRVASESLAYSSNIHPVIRKNASDAVIGILFYLFLAIPFALFTERLLVGHPDLRVQIAVQGLIFILFFLALWLVHPAIALVRSSYMILLGFITFGLAVAVSGFLAGRFSRNIAELSRRVQERAEVADVSRAGAAAAAFVLGLSNLRKRPVRTGLTIGVLILTTFVLLAFASVSTDRVDVELPLGKAPYTGLLVRDRNLKDVGPSVAPLRELYGEKHAVAPRGWAGNFTVPYGKSPELAQITVAHVVKVDAGASDHSSPRGSVGTSRGGGGSVGTSREEKSFETMANAVLGLSHLEPKATPVKDAFEVLTRWFNSDAEEACFLSRPMADQLRVDDEAVKQGAASVQVGGRRYTVLGIFDPARLDATLDIDGQPLLPADIVSMRPPDQPGGTAASQEPTEIPEATPRLPAARVVITPLDAMPSQAQTGSVAVAFQGMDYRSARDLITSHLERAAEPAYYGLDGVAFYGGKFRTQSVEGILDLILPIVIAALTVLNTMRGSVYERRSELYVFNAVGLSPVHIRWLFLAEACVYAVVGVVGGYLLAQGASATLNAFGLKAGLTMNYSSLASVFVSVIVMGVVLASSLYPARMAARLAAPGEFVVRPLGRSSARSAAGIRAEARTTNADAMELDLPFTFNRRDRVAIVPYFVDWFDNYGEGSSGEFFCSPPRCGVRAEPDGSAAPVVGTTAWLKPYDLGVSQSVEVIVRRAPATGDNVATVVMTRASGDRDSWERCNHAFIGLLRKRFLTWRAIPNEERARLLERGRRLLEQRSDE